MNTSELKYQKCRCVSLFYCLFLPVCRYSLRRCLSCGKSSNMAFKTFQRISSVTSWSVSFRVMSDHHIMVEAVSVINVVSTCRTTLQKIEETKTIQPLDVEQLRGVKVSEA
jgi:hypothetical protein